MGDYHVSEFRNMIISQAAVEIVYYIKGVRLYDRDVCFPHVFLRMLNAVMAVY